MFMARFMQRRVLLSVGIIAVITAAILIGGPLILPNDLPTLRVELGSRSVSKLPFVIALDQSLYEKYGVDVEIWMPPPDFEGGTNTFTRLVYRLTDRLGIRSWEPDIIVRGGNSQIFRQLSNTEAPREVFLAATDCIVRAHIVAGKGVERLEDLKGKRLGVSSIWGNTGFAALLLAEHMGWDPIKDLLIVHDGNSVSALHEGRVDAFVANERSLAAAVQEGLPILASMSTWGEPPIAGNSVRVKSGWLEDPINRESARRFLQAMIEGIALFHQDRALVLDVLDKWHGITDQAYAEIVYEGGKWIPPKPYPCYEGIEMSMERYDWKETHNYSPEDFYDDSLMRELDDSGFIDSLYGTVGSDSP